MALLKKLGNIILSCLVAIIIIGAILLAPILITIATILGGFALVAIFVYFLLSEADNLDNEDN